MRNINKVILIGNIAREPQTKKTAGGQSMTTFVLATNRTWYDTNGQKQSQAEFHNILAWGKIADICQRFLQKGTLLYIEGYLKTRSWEHENGARLFRTEIVAQDVLVLDRGIRHEKNNNGNNSDTDDHEHSPFDDSDDFENEKPASEIKRTFQDRLSQGSKTVADTNISDGEENSSDSALDAPLFEEEK